MATVLRIYYLTIENAITKKKKRKKKKKKKQDKKKQTLTSSSSSPFSSLSTTTKKKTTTKKRKRIKDPKMKTKKTVEEDKSQNKHEIQDKRHDLWYIDTERIPQIQNRAGFLKELVKNQITQIITAVTFWVLDNFSRKFVETKRLSLDPINKRSRHIQIYSLVSRFINV